MSVAHWNPFFWFSNTSLTSQIASTLSDRARFECNELSSLAVLRYYQSNSTSGESLARNLAKGHTTIVCFVRAEVSQYLIDLLTLQINKMLADLSSTHIFINFIHYTYLNKIFLIFWYFCFRFLYICITSIDFRLTETRLAKLFDTSNFLCLVCILVQLLLKAHILIKVFYNFKKFCYGKNILILYLWKVFVNARKWFNKFPFISSTKVF